MTFALIIQLMSIFSVLISILYVSWRSWWRIWQLFVWTSAAEWKCAITCVCSQRWLH